MSYLQPSPPMWNRIVYCPFCNWMATLKPTKTNKLMLRCNNCTFLIFVNAKTPSRNLVDTETLNVVCDNRKHNFVWQTNNMIS